MTVPRAACKLGSAELTLPGCLCFPSRVLTSSALEQVVKLARSRLAAGAGHDEVLGLLRQRGIDKIDCIGGFPGSNRAFAWGGETTRSPEPGVDRSPRR